MSKYSKIKFTKKKYKGQKAVMAMLTEGDLDFKAKNVTTDKEGYFINGKGSINQEDKNLKCSCTK